MRLNQVTIPCSDLERSIKFYQELGLILIIKSEAYARFECPEGESTFSLEQTDKVIPSTAKVYFESHNLDQRVAGLKKNGVIFEQEPVDQPWLWREAWIRDPDGHPICIYLAGINRKAPPWRLGLNETLRPLPEWGDEANLPFTRVHSFVSGDPWSNKIRVRYFLHKDHKESAHKTLFGRVWFGPQAEGPPGHVHGGAQAAALDEVCGGCVWAAGEMVVAARLETEFLEMVPLEKELVLEGRIVKAEKRKVMTTGEIKTESGTVLARAEVLFVKVGRDKLVPRS